MSEAWERAYLGLGSNLGDRAATIQAAVERLAAIAGVRIVRRSSLYETEPVGYVDQPWFLNAVVEMETSLEPRALLAAAKAIEADLGRQPSPRWGPRAIDVDILLYGQRTVQTPELQVPHQELWNRLFVLVPLAELQPRCRGPNDQLIADRIAELLGSFEIRRYEAA